MKKWTRKLARQARTVSVSRLNQTLFKPPPADWREFQIANVHLLVLLNYLGVLELFHKEGGMGSPLVPQSDLVSVNPCRSRWGPSKEGCSLLTCRLPCCSVLHSLGPHPSPASMSYGFRNQSFLTGFLHALTSSRHQLWRLDGITMTHPPSRPEGFSSGIVLFLLSP